MGALTSGPGGRSHRRRKSWARAAGYGRGPPELLRSTQGQRAPDRPYLAGARHRQATMGPETFGQGPNPNYFTWDEVAQRSGCDKARWLVMERKVYNLSEFTRRHSRGSRVISHHAGQYSTDPFVAFHINKGLVKKYMNFLLIGELSL